MNLERVPLQTLTDQIMSGALSDAKTVALVLKARQYLGL